MNDTRKARSKALPAVAAAATAAALLLITALATRGPGATLEGLGATLGWIGQLPATVLDGAWGAAHAALGAALAWLGNA